MARLLLVTIEVFPFGFDASDVRRILDLNYLSSSNDMWQNAQSLLVFGLIHQVNRVAEDQSLNYEERRVLLQLSSALAFLPRIDPDFSCEIEIDFSWDDLNWIGHLRFFDSEFAVWSTMNQLEGLNQELNAQWQHKALKLTSEKSGFQLTHDPAHVWLWTQCFRKFCDWWLRHKEGNIYSHGYLTLQSTCGALILGDTLLKNPGDSS